MKFLLTVLSIYSVAAFADCQITSKKVLPENSRVSLYEKGKSLETHKLQDQDGLGTCYANTTSSMLTSILPGHPPISYVHAAVINSGYVTKGFSDGSITYVTKEGNEESDFTHGGYVCETILGLKEAGGACPTKFSLLENKELEDNQIQGNLLLGLGKYFDTVNQIKENPAEFAKFKQELSASFELINSQAEILNAQCLERKKQEFPSFNGFKTLISAAGEKYLKSDTLCAKQRVAKLKGLMSSKASLTHSLTFIDPSEKLQESFQKFLDTDTALLEEVRLYLKSGADDGKQLKLTSKKLSPKLDAFLKSTLGPESQRYCTFGEKSTFLLGLEPEEATMDFLVSMKADKTDECKNAFKKNDVSSFIKAADSTNFCITPNRLEEILKAVSPLVNVGALLNKQLYENLLDPQSLHAHQITNAVSPECLEEKNLIKLDKLSCTSLTMCDPSDQSPTKNAKYFGPKEGCYTFSEGKSMVRKTVTAAIDAGAALGVGVCSAFMDDPKARTGFCQKELPKSLDNSLHEMTLTGYRCHQGKIEYEILNSWGQNCPAKKNNKNEALECETTSDGQPNGRFWVKEDVIVDNLTDLTVIGVEK